MKYIYTHYTRDIHMRLGGWIERWHFFVLNYAGDHNVGVCAAGEPTTTQAEVKQKNSDQIKYIYRNNLRQMISACNYCVKFIPN